MTKTVQAVYEGGVFKPREPLTLEEGAAVELTVRAESPAPGISPEAILDLVEEVAALPIQGATDAFSGADHDKILYGGTDAW